MFNSYKSLKKKLKKIFKSETTVILLISILSIIWVLLYKFIFLNVPDLFKGASGLGDIFYSLLLSIISSTIFYFIIVYIPQRKKRKIVSSQIKNRIDKLYYDYHFILGDFCKIGGIDIPKKLPADKNFITKLSNGIKLTDKAPVIYNNPPYQPGNWFEYFEYYNSLEKHNISFLMNYWEEVPAEVKVLIDKLQTHTLWSGLRTYQKTGYSNKLSDLGPQIWHHLEILDKINSCYTE